MSGVQTFIDDTPGETRGVLVRDGICERLIVQRDSEIAAHRLGARSVGRVVAVDAALKALFVDLGVGPPFGFLAMTRAPAALGHKIEVAVTAEPRDGKGPALSFVGPAEGERRLISLGPDVAARLAALAPGVVPTGGLAGLDAGNAAEAEALTRRTEFPVAGIDLAVERTRALVAVDIDHAGHAGRDGARGRAQANRVGLIQSARLIRLKGWGGLVCIDLVGSGHDGPALAAIAKAAFAPDAPVAVGPVSRFGLMQLTIPWRQRPIEMVIDRSPGAAGAETRAIDLARTLRRALLTDTRVPRLVARCHPEEATVLRPLAERLGPRAAIVADAARPIGGGVIVEG